MKLKALVDEDFVNYKKPSLFIGTAQCDWKCCTEQGMDISMCQNSALAEAKTLDVPIDEIVYRYVSNPITEAIVIGGLEPMLQFADIINLMSRLRLRYKLHYVDIVIYTGYNKNEIPQEIMESLRDWSNQGDIIIKYGRYVPNQEPHYDEVLGVYLASDNQYAERICCYDKAE